jgi:LmbE family N-acetylglucosaminyl deacetylase/glycosyltransferase involved in cell wall biosynthesis
MMIAQQRVAALIPAHNESGRVGKVLAVLKRVEELDEIIVVDDGSTDATYAELQEFAIHEPRFNCLRLPANRGKGGALIAGAQTTQADCLLFLDADLLCLQPEHIRSLIVPVCAGQLDMAIGVFFGGRLLTDLSHWATPFMSGQRCLRASLFARVQQEAAAGYGVETAITLTARKEVWRYRYIPWRGVWHPSSETRHGVWGGGLVRLKMYFEVFRAVYRQHNWKAIVPTRPSHNIFLFLLFLFLIGASLGYSRLVDLTRTPLDNLQVLTPANYHRILVIAPHPDDETLGAAGLIQAGLASKAQVHVAVVTNGDGQAFGPFLLRFKMVPHAVDYIVDGEIRQSETLNGLRVIGLPETAVTFLGYPDHQLNQLWLDDWKTQCPIEGKYTRSWKSPYPQTYDSYSDYCGLSLLEDLRNVITKFKPDVVIVPHPNDDHPDHRAVSNFVRLALAELMETEPDYAPQILAYLVHYGSYPQPRGQHTAAQLLPPAPLSGTSLRWMRLDLTQTQTQTKLRSIQAYKSQNELLRSFLPSFARQNENFVRLPILDLPVVGVSSLTLPASETISPSQFAEPASQSARRLMPGSADLVRLQVKRLGDRLTLSASTRGALVKEFRYKILVKLSDGRTLEYIYPAAAIRDGSNTFGVILKLTDLGDIKEFGFAAEVQAGVILDQTGWHFVILQNPPWSGSSD